MKGIFLEVVAGFVALVALISGGLFFAFGYIGIRDGFEGILIFFLPSTFVFILCLVAIWKSRLVRAHIFAWIFSPEFK